jgi:hypothetical protein
MDLIFCTFDAEQSVIQAKLLNRARVFILGALFISSCAVAEGQDSYASSYGGGWQSVFVRFLSPKEIRYKFLAKDEDGKVVCKLAGRADIPVGGESGDETDEDENGIGYAVDEYISKRHGWMSLRFKNEDRSLLRVNVSKEAYMKKPKCFSVSQSEIILKKR